MTILSIIFVVSIVGIIYFRFCSFDKSNLAICVTALLLSVFLLATSKDYTNNISSTHSDTTLTASSDYTEENDNSNSDDDIEENDESSSDDKESLDTESSSYLDTSTEITSTSDAISDSQSITEDSSSTSSEEQSSSSEVTAISPSNDSNRSAYSYEYQPPHEVTNSQTVYINTSIPNRYHLDPNCKGLIRYGGGTAVSLEEAKAQGYVVECKYERYGN